MKPQNLMIGQRRQGVQWVSENSIAAPEAPPAIEDQMSISYFFFLDTQVSLAPTPVSLSVICPSSVILSDFHSVIVETTSWWPTWRCTWRLTMRWTRWPTWRPTKKMADMCTIVQTCQCLKKNDFSAFDVINELIRSHLTPYMSKMPKCVIFSTFWESH